MKRTICVLLTFVLALVLLPLQRVSAASEISQAEVSVVAPQAGCNPRYDYTIQTDSVVLDVEDTTYGDAQENGIVWFWGDMPMLPTDKFEVGEVYTVRVGLLRKNDEDRFRTSPAPEVTINGSDAYITYNNSMYVSAELTFPALAGYTVTFGANGGSGTMAPVTGIAGDYTLPVCTFTPPSGMVFKDWWVNGEPWMPGQTLPVLADVTVTAQWKSANKAQISHVEAESSDMETIPVLYGKMKIPTFTTTQGAPAYILASTGNLRWQKLVGGVWETQYEGRFTPGFWRISTQVRIDREGAKTSELAAPVTLTVNGKSWTVDSNGVPSVHTEYSMIFVYSPAFEIEDDPSISPPVEISEVALTLEGYYEGRSAAKAKVTTSAAVNVTKPIFAEVLDTNGDGVPDDLKILEGNFEKGKTYLVYFQFTAKTGYDIASLAPASVTLSGGATPTVLGYDSDEDVFDCTYMLKTPAHIHNNKTTTTKATFSKNGSKVTKCSVCGKKISTTTIKRVKTVKLSTTEYTYDGKVKTPSVTVKDSAGKTLKKDVDYTVSYESGRKSTGKYTVKITLKGNYSGTERVYFTIQPKKVTGVSASQTTTSITLKWKKVTGASGYRVYQYNTKTKKYEKVKDVTGTTLKISKLSAGTKYKFKVRAYKNDDGKIMGECCAVFETATKCKTPTLKVTSQKKGEASLSWTNVSGESGYQVYYSTKKDSGFEKWTTTKVNVTKGTKINLTSGKYYYFKVRAYTKTDSGTVYSAWSEVVRVKVK